MGDGKFKKGDKRPRRPKGVPNKLTTELKNMILNALDKAGGEAYLVDQANKSPNAFLALVGKVLPLTVEPPDGAGKITVTWEK